MSAAFNNLPAPPSHPLPPSLPSGWTQHVGPTGQFYYYNVASGESTYVQPVSMLSSPALPTSEPANHKKEKPLYKIAIPNTPWIRVKSTVGRVFFTHADRKESVWTVPDEIAGAVASMDWDALEEQAARDKEISRLQREVAREGMKRKAADDPSIVDNDKPSASGSAAQDNPPLKKRRRTPQVIDEGPVAIDEFTINATTAGDVNSGASDDDDGDDQSEAAFSSTSAEEAWQREMAEGLAKLANEEALGGSATSPIPDPVEQPPMALSTPADDVGSPSEPPAFRVPEQVNLSHEEARTLFKTLLSEKNPNPLVPFSSVMPTLITDPRYVLLPSQADRETVFNEWCRDAARNSRLAKISSSVPSDSPDTQLDATEDPAVAKQRVRDAYDTLLQSEVMSTRTSWEEFRRKWKKDRRFFAFGRDDREREKVFKMWLKDLGERKRAQARKAEVEFLALLKSNISSIPITANSQWKDVKRPLVKDPRYDAVGSSSLREELFNTFLTALSSGSLSSLTQDQGPSSDIKHSDSALTPKVDSDRKLRAERALRERDEQAKTQKVRVENDIGRSKSALTHVEAETEMMSFFVDAVRDPAANYHELEPTFAQHSRFSSSTLSSAHKRALFQQHLTHIREKYTTSLHALFLSYSPLLSSKYESLSRDQRASLDASLPAQKLGLRSSGSGPASMRQEWESWMSKRTSDARADFQRLLEENSFIEFWGKVGKIADVNEEDSKLVVPGEEDLEMSEMGGGPAGAGASEDGTDSKVDLRSLAKSITEKEVERVLKNDQRYRAFDHVPEERLRWVKDYLSSLSAPGRSVHVQSH